MTSTSVVISAAEKRWDVCWAEAAGADALKNATSDVSGPIAAQAACSMSILSLLELEVAGGPAKEIRFMYRMTTLLSYSGQRPEPMNEC